MEPDLEEDMGKYQIPAILFPYHRAVVTGFFASAGLGSFIFPLIDVREMGKRIGGELEIQVVE
jgi:preprotein translocase subunit SecB